MDPRSAILLEEMIYAFDPAVCPVSVWYGGQYIVHLGNSRQTMRVNFWSYWVVTELKHVSSILLCLTPLSAQCWFDSCDTGYRICAILSVFGRIGIISEWILFLLRSSLLDFMTITSSSCPLCPLNLQPYGVQEHTLCLIEARLFSSYLALLN